MPASPRRKALGQHFLRSDSVIRMILEETQSLSDQHRPATLLEIGPGKGALTEKLVSLNIPLLVVEKDITFGAHWKKDPRLKTLEGDFLEIPLPEFPAPLLVVSNLPYSASVAITERLHRISQGMNLPAMVLMFQAEVAQRIRAPEGDRKRGSLSVHLQNHWAIHRLCKVPPNAFSPPPDVDSEVLVFSKRPKPLITGSSEAEAKWESLLKKAFSQPRKMLRSNLAPLPPEVDGTLRPAQLKWEHWQALFSSL